jgi:hypothetical protein
MVRSDRAAADSGPGLNVLEGRLAFIMPSSPRRRITGIMKAQIDHLSLEMNGMRPTQGRMPLN